MHRRTATQLMKRSMTFAQYVCSSTNGGDFMAVE